MKVETFDNEAEKMWNISSHFLTMKELEIGKTKGTSDVKTFNFVYWGPLVFPFPTPSRSKNGLKLKGRKHGVLTVRVSFQLCSLFTVLFLGKKTAFTQASLFKMGRPWYVTALLVRSWLKYFYQWECFLECLFWRCFSKTSPTL